MTGPVAYRCSKCGAQGCKLWRQYQTFVDEIDLLCLGCAEADQEQKADPYHMSAIGFLVAAVPTDDGETFWGFTSVPAQAVAWWDALPDRPRDVGVPTLTLETLDELERLVDAARVERDEEAASPDLDNWSTVARVALAEALGMHAQSLINAARRSDRLTEKVTSMETALAYLRKRVYGDDK